MSDYKKWVNRAAWAATSVAAVLLLVKTIVWWYTDSVAILASLVDSLLDLATSFSSLLIVRFSLQPADDNHAFGHGKAESLAALAQSAFISGSAIFLVLSGVERFFHPQALARPDLGIYVSLFAIVVTGGLVLFQKSVVKKTGSQAIAADTLHYQSDLIMNAAIMLAMVLSYLGWPVADAVFGVGIGVFILSGAIGIAKQAIQSLLDHRLPEEEVEQIRRLVLNNPQVLGVHQLRTRRSGATRFIQLHLELDDDLILIEAHKIADDIEDVLLAAFPNSDIILHQEPVSIAAQHKHDKAVV